MKTLFISHAGSPGGAEYAMLSLCKKIEGAEVLLLDEGPFGDLLQEHGIPYRVAKMPASIKCIKRSTGGLASLKAGPAILGFLRQVARQLRPFGVVVPMSQKAFVLTVLTRLWVRRPVIWYMNDLIDPAHFSRHMARVMVRLANVGVEHVIVNSKASQDAWITAGGKPTRCSVSYSGIDSAQVSHINHTLVAQHRERFTTGAMHVGVMVGRIAHWKGQHVALEALTKLPDFRMIFLGEAMFGEHAYEQQLRKYVAEHDLEERAWFLGHRDDVLEIMAAADMVIHSSTAAEPFGRVIVEGMMVGTPVIATNAGGPREIIEDRRSGLLTPPGDADALRDAIAMLISDPEFAQELAGNGKARAYDLFDVDAMVRHFCSVRTACTS